MDESLTSKIEELEGEIDKMKLSKTHQIGMLTSIYSTVQYIDSVGKPTKLNFSPEVAFGNSRPTCDLLGLTSQKGELTK